jgi:hypothetical protein
LRLRRSLIDDTDADVPKRPEALVVYLIGEHARQQNVKVLLRQRCKLQQARVQPLQLAFRHRVEVDATNALLGTRALQPTKQDLSCARVCDRPLAQATLNLFVARGLTVTTRGAPALGPDPREIGCAGTGHVVCHREGRVGVDRIDPRCAIVRRSGSF